MGNFCKDNLDLKFAWTDTPSCKWIRRSEDRRTKWCTESTSVFENCPYTCGTCCQDDPTYTFLNDNGAEKDCKWLSQKSGRADKYCGRWIDGGVVRYSCPQTCDYCEEPVNRAPSPSKPPEPTSQPSTSCEDDMDLYYPFTEVPFCKWVRRKEDRRVNYCKKANVNNSCPYACGVCCRDDPSYTFVNNLGFEKDCAWIAK